MSITLANFVGLLGGLLASAYLANRFSHRRRGSSRISLQEAVNSRLAFAIADRSLRLDIQKLRAMPDPHQVVTAEATDAASAHPYDQDD